MSLFVCCKLYVLYFEQFYILTISKQFSLQYYFTRSIGASFAYSFNQFTALFSFDGPPERRKDKSRNGPQTKKKILRRNDSEEGTETSTVKGEIISLECVFITFTNKTAEISSG